MIRLPYTIDIKYQNVQNYTQDREAGIVRHLTQNNPDIILITSTSRTKDKPIRIQGYNTFTTNKWDERHAGSAIAIKKGLQFEILNEFICDTIGAKIETSQGILIVMTSYAPPRHPILPSEDLKYMINNVHPTIFAGDLNARHTLFGYTSDPNIKGRQLSRLVYDNKLNHIGPTFNTYFTRNTSTKPDCILSNNAFFLNYHITPGGIGISDHLTIDIKVSVKPIKIPCTPTPDINKVNWDTYKNLFSSAQEINLDGQITDEIDKEFDNLYTQINEAKDNVTPIRTIKIINNIMITSKYKRLTKKMEKYSEKLRTTGKTEYIERVIRNTQLMLIQEGNQCKREWWENQLTKIEQASKNNAVFWKQVKLVSGGKRAGTPNLVTRENGRNTIAKTDLEKTHTFTNTWSKVTQITPEENQQFCMETENMVEESINQNINRITPKRVINLQEITNRDTQTLPIDITDVTSAIKAIANKTPGPSKLKKPYISNLPPNIIKNITHLFNCCYSTGTYPKHFKTAEIVLIPKNTGPKTDPKNYRPISLLNILGIFFAHILNKKLVKHMEENGIIRESQHGFRKKRSSITLIANLYERIAREKAGGKTLVTVVLRDVKKAFDKVWHKGLIYKLMQSGLETPLLRILANFLQDRKAKIRVNKTIGDTFNLSAGVPQGDVLSPTLYLIMCNDYPQPTQNQQSKNFCKQYADDFTQVIVSRFNTKISNAKKEIHRRNVEEEIEKQNAYERLWKIKTNTDKFQIIHIGVRTAPNTIIEGESIPHTIQAKLLGMDFSYANFFTKQVKNCAKKATDALKLLYRFRYLRRKIKLRLYKALVLPHLSYPVIPLNALSKTQTEILQKVQNRGIRWICNESMRNCRLTQRHHDLKLEYIEDRLKRLAEGYWYKIEEEDSEFWRETLQIPIHIPHSWFPSAYNHTFN